MQVHAKIAAALLALGLFGMGVWKFIEPSLTASLQEEVSDAGVNGTITIGVDAWVGYFPLCSPEIKRRLNRQGYGLRCVDDLADYSERFNKLKRNDYQFAVATADSYVLNGKEYNYPGPIIAVIDESKGGDAIVARKETVPNLEALKSASNLTVAFTPNSPSHHLLKAVASHFDVSVFRDQSNFINTNGSEEALNLLSEGGADLAILWEPDVSKAIAKDYVRILGTEDTKRLIVDILLASQKVVKKNPQLIDTLLKAYFNTLKYYRNSPDKLIADIAKHYRISKKIASSLLAGVEWATLNNNAELWFGVSDYKTAEQGLVESIESVVTVLLDNNDFKNNPLPNEDPYVLLNSTFISDLYKRYVHSGGFTSTSAKSVNDNSFSALNSHKWSLLGEVGSLKERKISFSSGTGTLTTEGKRQIDVLMNDLKHYPNFRVEIRGHTGSRGNKAANHALSEERAGAVIRYLNNTHSIAEHRARAVGYGGEQPLAKLPGESTRAYNYRLPRVEIVLLREVL